MKTPDDEDFDNAPTVIDHDDNVNDDEMLNYPPDKPVTCTFAVTGSNDAFQSIFVCQTCTVSGSGSNGDEAPITSCICAGCADVCHIDHEVVYIGMGPSYCDCHKLSGACCELEEVSRQEAEKLGITSLGSFVSREGMTKPRKQESFEDNDKEEEYVMHAFRVPLLEQRPNWRHRLVVQARELVQHSRETFWVDGTSNSNEWCDLERLAWKIYQRHVQYYQLEDPSSRAGSRSRIGGAEWWVQVKTNTSTTSTSATAGIIEEQEEKNTKTSNEAIDLHYDKDEALAESFGLGYFPTLSTVTYLSGNNPSTAAFAPTVVVPHRYDQSEDEMINYLMISHPRVGKHVVFDGRLLHGAPSDAALRKTTGSREDSSFFTTGDEQDGGDNGLRLTFLVNIWLTGRPAGVHQLPDEIRTIVLDNSNKELDEVFEDVPPEADLEFVDDEPMERIYLDPKMSEDLNRIELPFVSKGATWIGDEDDGTDGIRLITFPPPPHEADTVLLRFGPGVQAYLERGGEGYDDEQDDLEEEEGGDEGAKPKGTYQHFYV